jgi:polyisoprenoid-binding protein YceI
MASLSEFFSDPASGGEWTVVPDQSTILVKAKSMWGLASVKLRYSDFSGEGQITAPQTVSGRLDIKAASVQTGIRKRDDHMRSADYFEVDKYPDINVVVTGADAINGDSLDLRTDLTIKGVTKSVVLKTKVTPVGDGGMRLSAQATIDRKEFGVDGNLMGMIPDNATISGDVVFRRG